MGDFKSGEEVGKETHHNIGWDCSIKYLVLIFFDLVSLSELFISTYFSGKKNKLEMCSLPTTYRVPSNRAKGTINSETKVPLTAGSPEERISG